MPAPSLPRVLAAILLILPAATAQAQSPAAIIWSNELDASLFTSTAAPITDVSGFTFELGNFNTAGGWSPTVANFGEWAGRWRNFATADYYYAPADPGPPAAPALQYFTGTQSLANNTVFAKNAPAYMWIHNGTGTGARQWFLATDATNWLFPEAPQSFGTFDTTFILPSNTSSSLSVIVGGHAGTQYAGAFAANPGSFSLQTASVIVPVPEPGSLFLTLLPAIALLGRRKRQDRSSFPRWAGW